MDIKLNDLFSTDIRDYSIYACHRAIPSGVDGLKPSQRKVLFGMKKLYPSYSTEVKVSIASASIMGVSAYHHGALDEVIVGMAQSFPGTNNIPLLDGIGQFGNRISPKAAASRYIFTRNSKLSKALFNDSDEQILNWLTDDGMAIEPQFYLPLLPIVLINGAQGMGTGYSTNILQYSPKQIRDAMIATLAGKKAKPLVPWFSGFTGTISSGEGAQWIIEGKYEIVNTTTIKITELPIGVYTLKYRDVLNALEDKGMIKTYDDNSTDEGIEFIVTVPRETTKLSHDQLMKAFKLTARSTENIVVWNPEGKIQTFESADALLVWFTEYRLSRITDRIHWVISDLEVQLAWVVEQIKFIKHYISRAKAWADMTTDEIKLELEGKGFTQIDRLLDIRIARLNADNINKLMAERTSLVEKIEWHKLCDHREYFINELKEISL